ncbi:MAG: hypothetical protein IKK57_09255 [Clostridia bacterium]|nr:hypothetical protein [Clostridia bacterium]
MPSWFANQIAGVMLRLGANNPRWREHLGHYLPVMKGVFPHDNTAKLLVFRILDAVEDRQLARAQRLLEQMRLIVNRENGTNAEKTLYLVLAGMYHLRREDVYEAARHMRWAGKYGHDFHMPRLILGLHYVYDRWLFERAYAELDKGIDCLYAYGTLDEEKRRVIAVMHSLMALCRTMMHQPEEAERLLTLAAPASGTPEYQHALATLRAVQGRRMEAETAMAALKKLDPARHDHWQEGIGMMLEGTHPHFTARKPDQEAIAAYWEWFAKNEKELRRMLNLQGPRTCHAMQREAFQPLVPEPDNIDMMGHDFVMVDGKPEMHFYALHSRNYQALIDALAEACPREVTSRWKLRAFPGSPWGTARETIAHYAEEGER